jgi:hypothetical protein
LKAFLHLREKKYLDNYRNATSFTMKHRLCTQGFSPKYVILGTWNITGPQPIRYPSHAKNLNFHGLTPRFAVGNSVQNDVHEKVMKEHIGFSHRGSYYLKTSEAPTQLLIAIKRTSSIHDVFLLTH